jgi:hypothetical protein
MPLYPAGPSSLMVPMAPGFSGPTLLPGGMNVLWWNPTSLSPTLGATATLNLKEDASRTLNLAPDGAATINLKPDAAATLNVQEE